MPTDFDWKTWKKKQQEPPPPPPEEPKIHILFEGLANALLIAVLVLSLMFVWFYQNSFNLAALKHYRNAKELFTSSMY